MIEVWEKLDCESVGAREIEAIEMLAEIGVMLLLFTIGLEFSIKRLGEMKRLVLIGGGLQVIVTMRS